MEARLGSPARLSLETTEDERGLRMVRDTTRAVLDAAGVPRDRVDDCLLVVGELSGNVVQHARSAIGSFRLVVECLPHDVLLTVADAGPGFELSDVLPVGGARGDGRVGGFGLPLVRTLCRQADWFPSPDGTTVRAAISLEPPAEELIPVFDFDLADFEAWDVDDLLADPSLSPRLPNDGLYRN